MIEDKSVPPIGTPRGEGGRPVTLDEATARAIAELRGMDTPWPLCDVIRTLRYATSHLLQYHDCDCDGWENYAGALEESQRYEAMLRKGE